MDRFLFTAGAIAALLGWTATTSGRIT